MGGYAVVFAVAALDTLAAHARSCGGSRSAIGAIVAARTRGSVHTKPTPTLGGAAMFVGFLVAMAVASQIAQFHEMFDDNSEPLGLLLARRRDVRRRRARRPPRRVAAGEGRRPGAERQRPVAVRRHDALLPRAVRRATTTSCSRPTSRRSSPCSPWSCCANAINLIDGLDGLAAGIVDHRRAPRCSSTPTGCSRPGCSTGSNIAPLVAIIAVGVCVGFLPYNFNPARIFMGDAGALFLGLLLATTDDHGRRAHRPTSSAGRPYFFFAPLLIPIVILGVPIVDTAFSFVAARRAAASRSRVADKDHLHHRLMRLGPRPAPHGRDPVARGPRCSRRVALLPDVHERGQRARCRSASSRSALAPLHLLPSRRRASARPERERRRASARAGAEPAESSSSSERASDLETPAAAGASADNSRARGRGDHASV